MEAQGRQLAYVQQSTAMPLRVLIDGRKLEDGGIGVYIDNTVRGLLKRGDIHLTVIASPEQASRVAWRNNVDWVYDRTKTYSLAEYFLLPRRLDFSRFDLFHAPHYTLPFGIPIPAVVTIHDLIHIERPEKFYYPFIARRLIDSAVKRASAVIAVSADTERAVREHLGADGDIIRVIPNSIPYLDGSEESVEKIEAVASSHEISEPYFISVVSNLKPHKGVYDLLDAYNTARQQYEMQNSGTNPEKVFPKLLLVGYGAENLRTESVLGGRISKIPGVSVLGAVAPKVLKELYASAEAVVVPSFAEGFCLPALEAQSVGTRVLCRPVPALQELVTPRDFVAVDFSKQALESILLKAAELPSSERFIDTEHLARFSLDNVTEQLCSVYYQLVPAAMHGVAA